jgi:hypothetical protein
MPKSRGRKPAKPRCRQASGNPRRRALDPLSAGVLQNAQQMLVQLLSSDRIPGDAAVPMLLPVLWVLRAADSGAPPNVCVSACQTLRFAYAQLGIRAELHAVELTVDDSSGTTFERGTGMPSWEGMELDGHCVLWLPDRRRLVDPTVVQFPEVARLALGPVVGKVTSVMGRGEDAIAITDGGTLPEGARFPAQRGNGLLSCTRSQAGKPQERSPATRGWFSAWPTISAPAGTSPRTRWRRFVILRFTGR